MQWWLVNFSLANHIYRSVVENKSGTTFFKQAKRQSAMCYEMHLIKLQIY